MCGLCGILNTETHWAEERDAGSNASGSMRRERLNRVAFLNRLLAAYSCSIADWQGSAYLLSTFTGKTEIANNLAEIWRSVEQMTGVSPDPLVLFKSGDKVAVDHAAR